LQEGRENANIDAGLGFIWRISVNLMPIFRTLKSIFEHSRLDRAASLATPPALNKSALAPYGVEPRGFQQKNFAEDLAALLPDARIIFDLGAYNGESAETFTKIFSHATVHSFEPSAHTFKVLHERLKDQPRVVLNNLAVSDDAGGGILHELEAPAANSLLPLDTRAVHREGLRLRATERVNTTTIDHYCSSGGISRIDLLKMDIQGSELRALRGAYNLLSSSRIGAIYTEVLFVPLYDGQSEFYEIANLLSRYRFSLFDFYNFSYDITGQLRWGDALFLPTG
jgi:FkbM family methyltransferase